LYHVGFLVYIALSTQDSASLPNAALFAVFIGVFTYYQLFNKLVKHEGMAPQGRVVGPSPQATADVRKPRGGENAIFLRIIIRKNGVFPTPSLPDAFATAAKGQPPSLARPAAC